MSITSADHHHPGHHAGTPRLARFRRRPLARRDRRPGLHPAQLHPVRRRRRLPARPDRAHHRAVDRLTAMFPAERERGIYDIDAAPRPPSPRTRPATSTANEMIVGLQTDAPLKRAIMPNGGWRMVEDGLRAYGYQLDPRSRRSSPHTARPTTRASSTSTRRRSGGPPVEHHHRPARRLRPRPDHRRLPPGRALRRRRPGRRQEGGPGRLDLQRSTEDVIRDREELAEQIRALA